MGEIRGRHWRVFSLSRRCCALLLILTAGCASRREQISKSLASSTPAPNLQESSAEGSYRVGFSDVVEIAVEGMPEYSGQFPVNVEGRIDLAALDNPRIDGGTVESIQRQLAQELDLPSAQIRCRVVDHRSRIIYVRGPIDGGDRAVPYQGPESAIAFIRRCGGLKPSANVKDIHVVRSNVTLGSRPQVFLVDLEAILLHGDPKTNLLLQSFDEVYIGELPRAKVGRALPRWLKPVYRGFCGVVPGFCPHDWREQIGDKLP